MTSFHTVGCRPHKASPIIFHGVTLLQGTGGLNQYALAALTALRSDPGQPPVEVWIPSALRHHPKLSSLGAFHLYAAPHPRRGFAFNHLFWVNCLALHLRLRRPRSPVFSPIEVYTLLPLRNLLVTAHDCYADRYGDPRKQGRAGMGRRLCVRQLKKSHILSVSEFTTRELGKLHDIHAPQIETVPNWLDRSYDHKPSPERLSAVRRSLELPEKFWLYVGGFRLNKNLPLLFDAYAATIKNNPSAPPLVIAGRIPELDTPFSGPFHAAIDRHPGLRERILFPGFVPDADLSSLYKLASLVICPSSYEGFGYPVIEALAVETPVIAARAASLTELGLPETNLFSPTDSSELISLLTQACHDGTPSFLCPLPDTFCAAVGEARFRSAIKNWLDRDSSSSP